MTDFSYQLYSSRNWDLSETLKLVGGLGYKYVEGYGGLYSNLDALDALKADLDANGLQMKTGHVGFDMLEDDVARVLEFTKALGMDAVFVPAPPTEDYRNGEGDWADLAVRIAEAAKPYLDAGLGFGYHNHHWEWEVQSDGRTALDMILSGEGVQLEFDVAWGVRAGEDVVKRIAGFGDKIVAAHVKDIAEQGACADEDGWADAGTGVMDWPAIMAALKTKTACAHFVMEHDNPSDHARFARRSIENARGF